MTTSRYRRVVLDLIPGSDPLAGQIAIPGGRRPFSGWMELSSHIDHAAGETIAQVRDAREADADAIAAIGRAGFAAVHSGHVPDALVRATVEQTYDVAALRACIRACAASPKRFFLVAERDGRVHGFVHFEGDRDEPELLRLYVDRSLLRSGLGGLLVDALEARLPAGQSYMLLVLGTNEGARAFYARKGFVEERVVNGPAFFARHMELEYTPEGPAVDACVLRRTVPG